MMQSTTVNRLKQQVWREDKEAEPPPVGSGEGSDDNNKKP